MNATLIISQFLAPPLASATLESDKEFMSMPFKQLQKECLVVKIIDDCRKNT